MEWVLNNLATIIIAAAVGVAALAAITSVIRNRRSGKSSCGCGCAGCAMKDCCQNKETKKNRPGIINGADFYVMKTTR